MSEEEETFTITWRVKNFSMCPVEFGRLFSSPVITIRKFGNSEWSLHLYPKGCKTQGFLGCYLKCDNPGTLGIPKVKFTMSVTSSAKCAPATEFGHKITQGYNDLISLEEIKKHKSRYLPNDTLTLKCKMKCENFIFSRGTRDEVFAFLAREYACGKNSLASNSRCCIETTVLLHTNTISWSIRNFQSLSKNQRFSLPVSSVMNEIPTLLVTLIKNSKPSNSVDLEISLDERFQNVFLRCAVSVANVPRAINKFSACVEDEFLFKTGVKVWSFEPLLDFSTLERSGYFEHTEGVLYLQFDFAFSSEGRVHHSEKPDRTAAFLPTRIRFPDDEEVFSSPSEGEGHCVVTLRAGGDRTFQVHKSVLTARSETFTAMFESDMREKATGVVDIPDVDPDILERMLSFLYSGALEEDLSRSDAEKLYAVASKYQILPLMDRCCSVLVSFLKVSNVCDVLRLADLHQDDRLMKSAVNFVIDLPDPVLVSQDWKNLMEKSPQLASKVMYRMLTK